MHGQATIYYYLFAHEARDYPRPSGVDATRCHTAGALQIRLGNPAKAKTHTLPLLAIKPGFEGRDVR